MITFVSYNDYWSTKRVNKLIADHDTKTGTILHTNEYHSFAPNFVCM